MTTLQTRQPPLLSPAVLPDPVLICRSLATGELLWYRTLDRQLVARAEPVRFSGVCGRHQLETLAGPSQRSARFAHEHQGRIAIITDDGELQTFNDSGELLFRRRLDPAGGLIAARGPAIWWGAVDLWYQAIDLQSNTTATVSASLGSPSPDSAASWIQADGSLVLHGLERLHVVRPAGSIKWSIPLGINYPRAFYPGDDVLVDDGQAKRYSAAGQLLADRNNEIFSLMNVYAFGDNLHGQAAFSDRPNWILGPDLELVEERDPTPHVFPWYRSPLSAGPAGLLFRLSTDYLVGSWTSDLSLDDPLVLPASNSQAAALQKHPQGAVDVLHDSIIRTTGGGFVYHTRESGKLRLLAVNSSGSIIWARTLPDGPHRATSGFTISDDGSRVYCIL